MVEPSPFEKLIGTTLGNYRLDQLVERNKIGPVFLASAKMGAACIVRFLDAPADLDSHVRIVYLGRFQQLANQVSALQHPHILPLLDYGVYQSMPYLVYPRASLVTLRSILARKGALDALTAGGYLKQIASALEYAHRHAVLHRNLSTNCIFIQDNKQLVVAEFGLMHMLELGREVQANRARASQPYSGSSESSAPEQVLGRPIDTYTDMYALGSVLYRLLTAHPPFTGKTLDEILQQHLHASPPPLATWRSDLPAALDQVFARAMAKEPAQRFQHPQELVRAYYQIVAPNEKEVYEPASGPYPPSFSAPGPYNGAPQGGKGTAPLVPERTGPRASAKIAAVQPSQSAQLSRRSMVTLLAAGGGVVVVAGVVVLGSHLLSGAAPSGAATSSTTQAGAAGLAATQGAATKAPAPASKGDILAHASDLPLNSATTFSIPNHQNPGVLIHLADNRFVAFDSTCTHAGCPVSYNQQDKLLECPCHGASFDPAKNAAVVQGPAQTPLTPIKIVVGADGTITAG
jgi:serine/threonine protein kinase/nitrite reductase/ring-hydroxylating ferredoxin subunit